jgi:Ca2+-binding EF-hand superfamily protein
MIDSTLTDNQIELLFKNCLSKCKSKGGDIKTSELMEYLKSIGIRMKSINLA